VGKEVIEMRMLRWICGITRRCRVRVRGTTKVADISKKIQENRLQWYGHVMRRTNDYVVRRVMAMEVEGKGGRGRPRRKWMDRVKKDLGEKGLSGGRCSGQGFVEKTHQKRRPHVGGKRQRERRMIQYFFSLSVTTDAVLQQITKQLHR